jgi:hypothetical protein
MYKLSQLLCVVLTIMSLSPCHVVVLVSGRPIYQSYDGSYVRAYDSSFQAGIFHLEAGDELRVELHDFSKNCRVISHADRTFFGAFRLHLARSN